MKRIIFNGKQCKYDVNIDENPEMPYETCSGCKLCELICSLKHEGVSNPSRARIHVVKKEPLLYEPVVCMQCEVPVCAEICPNEAIQLNTEGVISVVEEKCNGCGLCVMVCPSGAVSIDPIKKRALICDLCRGDPQCVKYCPAKVLKLECDLHRCEIDKPLPKKGWRGTNLYNLIAQKKRFNFILSKNRSSQNRI